jgi:hypothetical protein
VSWKIFFEKNPPLPHPRRKSWGKKKGIKGAAALFQDFVCSSGHVLDSDCQIHDLKYRYVRSVSKDLHAEFIEISLEFSWDIMEKERT